jgi:sodium/potassium-transporting ATPase subunit beta
MFLLFLSVFKFFILKYNLFLAFYSIRLKDKNFKNSILTKFIGNSPIDQENMGPIEFTPTQGFPSQYFPYTGHPDYMPPFVAIRFKSPVNSIAIGITCKLYAKNLNNTEDSEPSSILPFNLLIE